jgi:hypothetical protein
MLRLSAVALVGLVFMACDAPITSPTDSLHGATFARLGDPPPPPEDTEIIGSFGTTSLLRTGSFSLDENPPPDVGLLEFSLDGRYFVGGGGTSGWLRLSASTDNVVTLSDPRITFRADGNASGTGAIKVTFDVGFLLIDLANDVAGATFSQTCAAGGAPCATISIVGADFLDLDGHFSEIDGTLLVMAEVEGS